MRHFKIRVLSIALAVSLLFGSSTVFAAYSEGPWDSHGEATAVSLNEEVSVSFTDGGKWYSFTPATSGSYEIYSNGSSGNYRDSYVYLYDSTGNIIGYNDDGAGNNNNFSLISNLEAGSTYYIWATSYSSSSNEYPMYIVQAPTLTVSGGVFDVDYVRNALRCYAFSGSEMTIGLSDVDADTYVYYIWDGEAGYVEVSSSSDSTYSFTMGDERVEYRLVCTNGDVTKEFYYYFYPIPVPSVFINDVEQSVSSVFEYEITHEGQTHTNRLPMVTASFVVGTSVTLGVEEIEEATYSWADLNDLDNIEVIDGADGRELVCDDLAVGTHRFGVSVGNGRYIPVVFEITITESTPEPTPEPEVPADTTTYVAPPSDNHNDIDSFVERFYVYALGRNSDPAGKAYWSGRLMEDGFSGTELARGFLYSQEFINKNLSNEDYVTVLYATFLGRTPDAVGFDYWVSRLENGASRDDVFLGFAYSPEFGELCARYGIVR